MRSASDVEPRTSAKRSEQSTSAPPWLAWSVRKQPSQYLGFLAHRACPKYRRTQPPGGPNGAAHILQRGGLGMRRCRRRSLTTLGSVPRRRRRQTSDSGARSSLSLSSVALNAHPPALDPPRPRYGLALESFWSSSMSSS